MNPLRTVFVVVCLGALLYQPISAEEIEFQFTVYQTDLNIGIALEDRLIDGGSTAIETAEKLPDFIRQGRMTEETSLSFTSEAGKRHQESSDQGIIMLPSREAAAGLDIDVDPIISNGMINMNIYASYVAREKDDPVERTVTTQTVGVSGIPMLLCRWQRNEKVWLLIGTAKFKGGDAAEEDLRNTLYVETAFFSSVSSAKANRDCLESVRFPCRNGQRGRAEAIAWIDDENISERDQPGLRTLVNPLLSENASIQLGVESSYIIESGGTTRLDSGERARRLEIREVSESLDLKEGQPAAAKVTLAALDDIETKEDDHIAVFKVSRMALGDPKE